MRKWTAVLAVVAAALAASPGFAAETGGAGGGAAPNAAKVANIRKLVHIMSGKQMKDMTDKMLDASFRAVEARMPEEAREDPEARQVLQEFIRSARLGEKDLEEMMELMVPYYDKYLDGADIEALVRFYESPAGKKFVRVMPEMMVEMMPAILAWQMEKMKGPVEALQKKIEAIEERKKKESPAEGPRGR
ncbi:MAG: DUF2059 domain-containing protein [Gemmatimonadota bacterium]